MVIFNPYHVAWFRASREGPQSPEEFTEVQGGKSPVLTKEKVEPQTTGLSLVLNTERDFLSSIASPEPPRTWVLQEPMLVQVARGEENLTEI